MRKSHKICWVLTFAFIWGGTLLASIASRLQFGVEPMCLDSRFANLKAPAVPTFGAAVYPECFTQLEYFSSWAQFWSFWYVLPIFLLTFLLFRKGKS